MSPLLIADHHKQDLTAVPLLHRHCWASFQHRAQHVALRATLFATFGASGFSASSTERPPRRSYGGLLRIISRNKYCSMQNASAAVAELHQPHRLVTHAVMCCTGSRPCRDRLGLLDRGSCVCGRALDLVHPRAARGAATAARPSTAAFASARAARPPCAGALRAAPVADYHLPDTTVRAQVEGEATPRFRSSGGCRTWGLDTTTRIAILMTRCAGRTRTHHAL